MRCGEGGQDSDDACGLGWIGVGKEKERARQRKRESRGRAGGGGGWDRRKDEHFQAQLGWDG